MATNDKKKPVQKTAEKPVEKPAVKTVEQPRAEKTPAAPAPVYQMVTPKEPMVKMIYIDSCIPDNEIPIGNGRVITGSGRVFSVTLSNFEGEFQNPFRMRLLKKRNIIVLDGLTEEQRELYGVNYSEGEVIKNEGMFDYIYKADTKDSAQFFKALCPEHREMVARRIHDAYYEEHDNRLNRVKIEMLNEISKGDYEDGRGAFSDILHSMNEAAI